MGVGHVIAAAAAAAAPSLRNYIQTHRRTLSDDSDGTIIPSRPLYITPEPSASHPRDPEDLLVDEMARKPLLVDTQSHSRQSSGYSYHGPPASYGTITNESSSAVRTSPERYRRDSWLDRVPEEAAPDEELENEDEWDLEEQGYYRGSYKRTVMLYALVPLTSLVVFLLLALLPHSIWSTREPTHPTLPRSFPSPLPELILSGAFFSLSHHLRVPIFNLASLLLPRVLDTLLFSVLHVLLSQSLHLAALAALRVRHEMAYPRPTWHDTSAFRTVWWLALGWGLAEAATSVVQGYSQLALYENVMVPVERVQEILAQARGHAHTQGQTQTPWGVGSFTGSVNGSRESMPLSPRSEQPATAAGGLTNTTGTTESTAGVANETGRTAHRRSSQSKDPMSVEEAIRLAVDQDMEQLIHMQEREELEEVYGMPVIYIPVFVRCLQRIDAFLFSLGFTLILAWAYLLSPLSFPAGYEPPTGIYSNHPLAITFPLVVVVHLFLSLLHSPLILPRIGVHTTAYVGLLVGLGGFFTGLGLWGALS